jgi:hypothetical protein
MRMGPPAPCVSACVDAVDATIREPRPSHGMSTLPRAWLACCVTAVLVTNAMGWARVARARLGTYALAALSWMLRHRQMPWDALVGARVRVILRHDGLTCGRLVIADTDPKRATSAHTLAHLYNRRDQASGGDLWGATPVLAPRGHPRHHPPGRLDLRSAGPRAARLGYTGEGPQDARRPPTGAAAATAAPSVRSHHTSPGAAPVRPIPPARGPGSRRLPSLARRPVSTAPRRCAVACRASRRAAAIRKSACRRATRTWRTMVRPLPGHRRPSASGAVQRWGRWAAVHGCPSAPTAPHG